MDHKLPQEKYRVKGRGAIVLALFPGDHLTVTDPEGGQSGEILAFDSKGRDALFALGLSGTILSPGFKDFLTLDRDEDETIGSYLKQQGVLIDRITAATILNHNLTPGQLSCVAQDPVFCLVAAPGLPMEVTDQKPSTDLFVSITRHSPVLSSDNFRLPEPFFEPKAELRIHPGCAFSYEVEAGDYIQIIDVAGKQCSDFLAFDGQALEKELELGIDMTATRTLMGSAYPKPGLFSKFYDQQFQALVEVVRDTVGRHDSFGFACTAKFYEDLGYPGHKNCSDNFNGVLEKYFIKPRSGWPAINFFYNTAYDKNFVLFFDEPWSRPGDYVLLRAMKHLVCASSSCPDDTDPANGWNPTDIHVRVYPPRKNLSKGIAYRMTRDSVPELTQETSFHPRTSSLTRSFTEYRNFWLPTCFTGLGPIEEYWACRENVSIMDLSALRKFEILGPDAEMLLQRTLTRNIRKLSVGQVVYSAMCQETGGMIDDGTLFRLGMDGFRWIGGCDYSGIWLREQAQKMGLKVLVKSSTNEIHNLSIQGPKSRDILKDIIWTRPDQPTVAELKWFRFTIGRIKDFNGAPLIISRTGYSGELGYEIWCHPRHALAIWDAVWASGEPAGMKPLGFSALDMLRIESGLIFAGYEFDDQTDPFEAGIGFTVALDKEEDFIGKPALVNRKLHPQRALVGLELEGNETAHHGDCVHVGRNQVGVITSATRSPILSKNIALCRISTEFSGLFGKVEVGKLDGHQKRIPAQVVKFPFYDPEKLRPRA